MRIWILFSAAAACLISGCDGRGTTTTEKAAGAPQNSSAPQNSFNATPSPRNETTSNPAESLGEETARASLTPSQNNAVRSAEQYLSMTGFSRNGLIQQLSSDAGDGYSISDATAAVDSLSVDWNENAARSARQYLEMSGFSCRGLIQQLSSSAGDKYTVAQATYGAHAAGAC
ncbi:Ltp family lipoprotein [Allosphingosinicella sp.]|uniref:Ltp family lipoprotein n=1 Tax=Allosphingosinicella sp. TaxID=2823234 RepID=UPI003782F4DE